MSDYIPYNITTEAGKKLWTEINAYNGSSVWGPVGEGIEKIEKELLDKMTTKIQAHILSSWAEEWGEDNDYDNWQCGDCGTWYDYTTKHCHKKLDDYLGVRGYSSIEEAIMSVTQKAIDAVPLTYLKIGSQFEPTGYWKNVNDIFVYVTNDKPQVYTLGNSSTSL